MSNYLHYITSAIKLDHQDPNAVIPKEKTKELNTNIGFYCDYVQSIIESFKPIIISMNDQLPQIQSGPILSLSTDFAKISSLSDVITAAANEIDKAANADTQCSECIIEAYNHLGQFNQYIPHLTSSTAPSMASYIPSLQQSLQLVIETLDKCLELLTNIRKDIKNLPESTSEFANWKAACNRLAEYVVIYLSFFTSSESFTNEFGSDVQNWIQTLQQLTMSLIEAQKFEDVQSQFKSIATQTPSLIVLYANAESHIHERSLVLAGTNYLIQYLGFVYSKVCLPISETVVRQIKQVPDLLSNGDKLREIAKSLLEEFVEFVNTDYIAQKKECQNVVNMARSAIDSAETEPTRLAELTVSLARCIGAALLSAPAATAINETVDSVILTILNKHLANIQREAESIVYAYTLKLESFSETTLGEVNFYTTTIQDTKPFNPSDSGCLKSISNVFSCAQCLPAATRVLGDQCDDEYKDKLHGIADNVETEAASFSRWYEQLVSSVATNTQSNYQAGVSVLAQIFGNQQLQDAEQQSILEQVRAQNQKIIEQPVFMASNVETAVALHNEFPEYCKLVSNDDKSQQANMFRRISDSIRSNTSLLASQISEVLKAANKSEFSAFVKALIGRLIPLASDAQELDSIANIFEPLYIASTALCSVLGSAPSDYEDLKQFPQSIKTSLGVIWPLIVSGQTDSLQTLQNYLTSLAQLLTECQSAIETVAPPFMEVDIPAELRTFRMLENTISSLPSSAFRIQAGSLLDAFADMKTEEAMEFCSKWFQYATQPPGDVNELLGSLKNLRKGAPMSEVIDTLAKLHASITKMMEDMSEEELAYAEAKMREVLELLKAYLANPSDELLQQLIASYANLANIKKFSNIDPDKRDEMFRVVLFDAISQLDALRRGEGNLADAIAALLALESFLYFNDKALYEQYKDLIQGIICDITKGDYSRVGEVIKKLSELLRKLSPDRTDELSALTDQNTLCDLIYDRAELFREMCTIILKAAKQRDAMGDVVSSTTMRMSTLSFDASVILFASMKNTGLDKTLLMKSFCQSVNEVLAAFAKFQVSSKKIGDSGSEDITQELRRLSRTMLKGLDGFINIVETPPKAEKADGFETQKALFAAALANAYLQCARVTDRINVSPSKDMLDPNRGTLLKALDAAFAELTSAYKVVTGIAVGHGVKEFNDLYNTYTTQYKAVQSALNAGDDTKAKTNARDSCDTAPLLIQALNGLNDHIIILPDPVAAGKLPSDLVVPPAPNDAPQASDVFASLQAVGKSFKELLAKFKTTVAQGSNDQIVKETIALHNSANKFAEQCQLMAVATSEARLLVEIQTMVHSFANAFTSLQNAVCSKLMVAPNADSELQERIQQVETVVDQLIALCEQSCNAQSAPDDDEGGDEVTNELKATAAALEDMSRRLAEFGAQFGDSAKEATVGDDEVDYEEDGAEPAPQAEAAVLDYSLFPSFVISQAQAILRAAALILKRSMEITRDLVSQLGHLSNERMLISLAQELTDDAGLILICAEMLAKGEAGEDPEFKVIAAAKIVKATVSQLVAQVLVQGGDSQGIMSKHVRTVRICSNHIVRTAEAIVRDRVTKQEAKKPKRPGNKVVQKLNAQTVVNEKRKELQDNEAILYKFRKQSASSRN